MLILTLLNQVLCSYYSVGNEQKQNAEINCQIACRNRIKQVPADAAEITVVFKTGFIQTGIHFLDCLHQAEFIS